VAERLRGHVKTIRSRVATTHIDRHNERLAREALEGMARDAADHYIPVMWNHDIRYPPLGRVVSAQVVALGDGEYALETITEYWEQGDTVESLRGDGWRSLRLRIDDDYERFVVRCDRTFLDEDGRALVQDIAALSGAQPQQEGKKALEPVSALVIAAGAFVLGSVASGFFRRLGSDVYDALKNKLKTFLERNPGREFLVDFEMVVESEGRRFEAHVLVDEPSPHKMEELFGSRFSQLDEIVEQIQREVPEAARVVLEWRERRMRLRYVVRNDGVPLIGSLREPEEAIGE
jgi:hypothetical protein